MFKIYAIIFGFFITVSAVAEESDATAALEKSLANFDSLSGNFNQQVLAENENLLQRSYGKVLIKRPGNFKWEIEGPEKYLIVADGENLWNYDVELEQVTVQAYGYTNTTPAILLGGNIEEIKQLFKITYCLNNKNNCYHLIPKEQDMNVKWLELEFKNGKLSDFEFVDKLEQKTSIKFSDVELNVEISAEDFNFVPPAGVDVLGMVNN